METQDKKWIATRLIFVFAAAMVSWFSAPDSGAVLHPETRVAAEITASNAVFFPQANGTMKERAALLDAPDGQEGRVLGPNEKLQIGGKVEGRRGVTLYWVSVTKPDGTPDYKFVPSESVIVDAGHVPELMYNAAPKEAWLAPETATTAPQAVVNTDVGEDPPVQAQSSGQVSISWLPETVSRYADRITAAAQAAHVDPDLVAIIVTVESGGSPTAGSGVGARGLMQLMPGTAAEVARNLGIYLDSSLVTDVDTNLTLGSTYLASMLRAFGVKDDPDYQRSVELAASAYNGGPGRVGQHVTTGQPLPNETAHYQRWVGGMWRERHDQTSPTYEAWLAAGGQVLVDKAMAEMEEKVSMTTN